MRDSTNIVLGGFEVSVPRARLGLYLQLAQMHIAISKAVKATDIGACADCISRYIRACIPSTVDLTQLSGAELLSAFIEVVELNTYKIDIPMSKSLSAEGERSDPWDYDGRITVLWIHVIASRYGWSKETIENLWPEEAAAYIEEILVDEQLSREWTYSLSQFAYKYDKKGKGTYVPLNRPAWMRKSGEPKPTRIPRSLIPMGTIIDLSGISQGGPRGLD